MSAIGPERYRTRVPFRCVMEGVRIDEELARKASVVHPIASANLAPSAKLEEVRHRRGHRPESGCRFDLSWVRGCMTEIFKSLDFALFLLLKYLLM